MSPNMFKRLFCCIAAEDDALPPPSIVAPAVRPRPSPPSPPSRPSPPSPPTPSATTHRQHHHHSIPLSPGMFSPATPPPHDKNFFKGNGSWRESETMKRIMAGPYADDPPRPRRAALPRRISSPPPPRKRPPPPSPQKPIWLLRAEGSAERIAARAPSMTSLETIIPDENDLARDWTMPFFLFSPPQPLTMAKSDKPPKYRFSSLSSTTS